MVNTRGMIELCHFVTSKEYQQLLLDAVAKKAQEKAEKKATATKKRRGGAQRGTKKSK
jgi:hypothetical protein